ncbi:unnamed protein product [Pedinophyceae sp. YPF-701]|nr:unnamed protein product [Pedinophyceae sp. YPF-701]
MLGINRRALCILPCISRFPARLGARPRPVPPLQAPHLHDRSCSSATMAEPATASYCYKWPRPGLTVDTVVVAKPQEPGAQPQLLLIQRLNPPYQGSWACPGGYVDEFESLDHAAARELREETGVDATDVELIQVGGFGEKGRDPRGWTVTVAYGAIVPTTQLGVKAADDAADARWYAIDALPKLAFDHKLVVRTAFRRLAMESHADDGLKAQLRAAADLLEGPWKDEGEGSKKYD